MSQDDFWAKVTGTKPTEKTGEAVSKQTEQAIPQSNLPQSSASPPTQINDPFSPTSTVIVSQYKGEDCESCDKFGQGNSHCPGDQANCSGYVNTTGAPQYPKSKSVEETATAIKMPINVPSQIAAPPSATTDPFAMTTTPQKVETETVVVAPSVPATSTASAPPAAADPFANNTQKATQKVLSYVGRNFSWMFHGEKGTGKTVAALSLPGRIFSISMDGQTFIIWEEFYDCDPRIKVVDGMAKFNSKDPVTKLRTATDTIEYINKLLEEDAVAFQPDWIFFDGTERLTHVSEMAMRDHENLQPTQGISNLNVWKLRNDYINNFVQRAGQIAKQGVIYTAYTDIKEFEDANGNHKRKCAHWFGDIEQKTQVVIETMSQRGVNGRIFSAEVESSKSKYVPTGNLKTIGECLNTGERRNFVGVKVLFTPEGIKKFFSEVKQ